MNEPMHLLQICTNFRPGGIQRHVCDLTGWLRDLPMMGGVSEDHLKVVERIDRKGAA